jgi:hypothetical protein
VSTALPCSLSARWTQGTVEEELRASIPHQTVPLQVEVCLDVEGFRRVRIVGVGSSNTAWLYDVENLFSPTASKLFSTS